MLLARLTIRRPYVTLCHAMLCWILRVIVLCTLWLVVLAHPVILSQSFVEQGSPRCFWKIASTLPPTMQSIWWLRDWSKRRGAAETHQWSNMCWKRQLSMLDHWGFRPGHGGSTNVFFFAGLVLIWAWALNKLMGQLFHVLVRLRTKV